MINITNILSEEHQTILKAIDAVLQECTNIEKGKELNKSYFEDVVYFIKNYADKFHHSKEEDVLFHAMLQNQELMHCNPIPVMLHEHDDGRSFVANMEEGLKENNKAKVIENAMGYCHLLQQHIYKEDNILYPMAEDALDNLEKDDVLKKYEEIRDKSFTEEKLKEMFLKTQINL